MSNSSKEFEKAMNGIVVDVAFGVFDRGDLPKFVERAVEAHHKASQELVREAVIKELERLLWIPDNLGTTVWMQDVIDCIRKDLSKLKEGEL